MEKSNIPVLNYAQFKTMLPRGPANMETAKELDNTGREMSVLSDLGYGVWCPKKHDAEVFVKIMSSFNKRWCNGDGYVETHWTHFGEDTIYYPLAGYMGNFSIDVARNPNLQVYRLSDMYGHQKVHNFLEMLSKNVNPRSHGIY